MRKPTLRPWKSRQLARAVTAAIACSSRLARASDPAAAQALFEEAKKLAADENYALACPRFAESQRVDPAGGTLLHLAACHESEGKTASAWTEFNEALSVARRDGRADREAFARAHITGLAAKLVTLTVVVTPEARASGLTVRRDGLLVDEAQWGMAIPVDPGEHSIEAAAPGCAAWSRRVRVEPGGVNVTVTVLPLPSQTQPRSLATAERVPTPVRLADDQAVDRRDAGQRTVGVLLAVAGLAAAGVGGVFEVRAQLKKSDSEGAALRGDRSAAEAAHDQAKSAEKAALVAGALGALLVGAGVAVYLSAPGERGAVALRAGVTPGTAAVVLSGEF
jgi:hypothetical protein